MKQLILSCFLLLRLSQTHVTTTMSGLGGFTWKDKSVRFMLPVSCKVLTDVKEGDNFLHTSRLKQFIRGDKNNWEMIVVKKIVVEDGQEEFSCY